MTLFFFFITLKPRVETLGSDSQERFQSNLPPPAGWCFFCRIFFFFITLEPRVDWYTKSVSLKYEPVSEPLHILVKKLFSN